MPMSSNVLAAQLLALTVAPSSTEAQAVQKFADAYALFASDALASVPITPAGVALGKAAMLPSLVGLSVSGSGAAVLTTAVAAFWAAVAGGLATSFAGAVAITPPPHAGLTVGLQTQGDTNVATKADAQTATNAIAAVFRTQALVGGTVTIGVTVFPIT